MDLLTPPCSGLFPLPHLWSRDEHLSAPTAERLKAQASASSVSSPTLTLLSCVTLDEILLVHLLTYLSGALHEGTHEAPSVEHFQCSAPQAATSLSPAPLF